MKKNGFSLIELSITLIIISTLIAGIVSIQSLIKSAKIMRTEVEFKNIEIGIRAYYVKNDILPGDLNKNGKIEESEAIETWNELISGGYITMKTTVLKDK
jgi:prepilin-type N-terminal cleavage/methylation domain-containing protein